MIFGHILRPKFDDFYAEQDDQKKIGRAFGKVIMSLSSVCVWWREVVWSMAEPYERLELTNTKFLDRCLTYCNLTRPFDLRGSLDAFDYEGHSIADSRIYIALRPHSHQVRSISIFCDSYSVLQVFMDILTADIGQELLPPLSNLTHLRLSNGVSQLSPDLFIQSVSFPSLRVLVLDDINLEVGSDGRQTQPGPALPQLQRLELLLTQISPLSVTTMLHTLRQAPSLETFSFNCTAPPDDFTDATMFAMWSTSVDLPKLETVSIMGCVNSDFSVSLHKALRGTTIQRTLFQHSTTTALADMVLEQVVLQDGPEAPPHILSHFAACLNPLHLMVIPEMPMSYGAIVLAPRPGDKQQTVPCNCPDICLSLESCSRSQTFKYLNKFLKTFDLAHEGIFTYHRVASATMSIKAFGHRMKKEDWERILTKLPRAQKLTLADVVASDSNISSILSALLTRQDAIPRLRKLTISFVSGGDESVGTFQWLASLCFNIVRSRGSLSHLELDHVPASVKETDFWKKGSAALAAVLATRKAVV